MEFYSFYKLRLGHFSDQVFNLFWHGKFLDCLKQISSLVPTLGSPIFLGQELLLIYNYCSIINGADIFSDLKLPPPPNPSQLHALFAYEELLEIAHLKIFPHEQSKLLIQPQYLSKAILAAKLSIDHHCSTIIETGTFLGQSTYLFSGLFDNVHSIEADPHLHAASSHWLSTQPISHDTAHCHLGNSPAILTTIAESTNQKCAFFLDAHYSTGITSSTYGICPLLHELNVIFSCYHKPVILIDDIRCMSSPGYPSIEEILALIPSDNSVEIRHDQMIIAPL